MTTSALGVFLSAPRTGAEPRLAVNSWERIGALSSENHESLAAPAGSLTIARHSMDNRTKDFRIPGLHLIELQV